MARRDLRLLLALCVVGGAWLIAQSVIGLSTGLLFLAPATIMALPLLAGRYVGVEQLSRFSRSRRPRRRAVPIISAVRCALLPTPPRGGLLIASSLAVRPPPLALHAD
jgi:hypothetical protein